MKLFRKVAVGISGGVDSAVAALLLKQKCFEVHGVFMKNWDIIDETGVCTSQKDYEDAFAVCQKINIPLTQIDFVKHYWNEVFENLLKEYQSGLTPNPDILCNRHIKFKYFYKYCFQKLQVDAIATGHYCDTSFGPFLENYQEKTAVRLLQPFDKSKDQTFFLSQVEQEPLRKTMFPLAHYRKVDVRSIALREGLTNVATKRDSCGICFIGKRQFKDFISEYIQSNSGNFIDIDTGQIVGQHKGIHMYTLGQRARIGGKAVAFFLVRKMDDLSTILVAQGTNHSALMSKYFFTETPYWIHKEPEMLQSNNVLECDFRFQHLWHATKCRIMKYHNNLVIILEEPMRSITPGQYAVFYLEGECLGGAKITYCGPSQYFLK